MFLESNKILPNGLLRKIRDTPNRDQEREIIERLWQHFKPYADDNFISAFAVDFQGRFWEMYLGVMLLEQGYKLCPRSDLGREGPDICLLTGRNNIWIEAIAVGTSANDRADLENDTDSLDDQVVLRYCSAITEKFKKYEKYLGDGTINKSESYIIAVNGSRIPFSQEEIDTNDIVPNIVKSVLPFGEYAEIIDSDTRQTIKTGYSYRDKIYKETGMNVPTNLFTDDRFSGISGVLHSNVDITSALNHKRADFIFVHNHNTTSPLPFGWLKLGSEYFFKGGSLNVKL